MKKTPFLERFSFISFSLNFVFYLQPSICFFQPLNLFTYPINVFVYILLISLVRIRQSKRLHLSIYFLMFWFSIWKNCFWLTEIYFQDLTFENARSWVQFVPPEPV